MSLDNSSCNLASLNLMKFLKDDDTFDAATFVKAVELIITAMDISICFADFPTEAIGETTRDYRQLGIGYANLGALLMATGHGYDSEGGRALAAAITSLMTGTAYKRSAELAGDRRSLRGLRAQRRRAQARHAQARCGQRRDPHHRHDRQGRAPRGDEGVGRGHQDRRERAGATRRLSVLAPTGTIGFMMDCDTTGIEPDFSLVKFKKLVGGGSMQIVNQTIPRALRKLGYAEETIEAIVEYIAENGHVIDAPGLQARALRRVRLRDGRALDRAHGPRADDGRRPAVPVRCDLQDGQPAGDATVEEIEDVYFQGWKLGLKALAVYRDNCKVGQPLSDGKDKSGAAVETVIEYRPTRKRLPKKRPAQTTSFAVGGAEGYMTASSYPDDGLGEIFLKMSKQGSTLAGVMDAFSIAISIGLQYGVPLETFVSKFVNMRFEPAGLTDDPDVRMAQSMMDYIFRRLALDYLDFETRAAYGIYTADERSRQLETGSYLADDSEDDLEEELETLAQTAPIIEKPVVAEPSPEKAAVKEAPAHVGSSAELLEVLHGQASDAPLCMSCGTKMRPAGSCYVCEGCGSTSGCS